jgi:hypothetical protein
VGALTSRNPMGLDIFTLLYFTSSALIHPYKKDDIHKTLRKLGYTENQISPAFVLTQQNLLLKILRNLHVVLVQVQLVSGCVAMYFVDSEK